LDFLIGQTWALLLHWHAQPPAQEWVTASLLRAITLLGGRLLWPLRFSAMKHDGVLEQPVNLPALSLILNSCSVVDTCQVICTVLIFENSHRSFHPHFDRSKNWERSPLRSSVELHRSPMCKILVGVLAGRGDNKRSAGHVVGWRCGGILKRIGKGSSDEPGSRDQST
jgi:hypothetical protein